MSRFFLNTLLLGALLAAPCFTLAADMRPAANGAPAAAQAAGTYRQAIECLRQNDAGRWQVELPPANGGKAFELQREGDKDALRVFTAGLEPARTTVKIMLPGDAPENGDVWTKSHANYISFLCKSDKPADMTFHLLQHGKTSGAHQAAFSAAPGDWQRIILPMPQFGLKSMAHIAGVGVRLASAAAPATVDIADITVGAMPYNDDSWKAQRTSISLKGDWQFALDPGDTGTAGKWYADGFDDTAWKTLQSGKSWQEQGIPQGGWGWYRKKIMVPKEASGIAMSLALTKIASDDEAWVNGVRVGGWSGEYKYDNEIPRVYTVPASVIRYGEENTITLRIWGGDLTFIGNKSGLIGGPLTADFDPYHVLMRDPGGAAVPAELYDLSDARQGKPFEIVVPLPAELAAGGGASMNYHVTDYEGGNIVAGKVPLTVGSDGTVRPAISLDREAAHTAYLRGRLRIAVQVEDAAGNPLYAGVRDLDHLSFAKRDNTALPPLPEETDETPYGKLKLVDEIDCGTPLMDDPHPYLQSGFDKAQMRVTPGSAVNVKVEDILGRKARESDYGWFAYRVGRGKLKPHTTYLMRIEYPEDKPRFAPIEIQTGQNYMDVGWKNGVGADDPYDNWPLSGKWQSYDVIVPLDDETVGTGGTGTAKAENGVWVYFMNKLKPNAYYAMWSGGPAVGKIKLYEIDPEKNAPQIRYPEGLPHRLFSFDWERQPDSEPADFCRYAKLMGYNGISPVIIKWGVANYSPPLNGYNTIGIDARNYWVTKPYDPASGVPAGEAVAGKKSQHELYLDATKRYDLNYIPRIEWGGSMDLPKSAWAIDPSGNITKPNRFASWCANLLNPVTFDDLQKLTDHLIKPYVKDNPQLTGVLWRIRSDRLPISYGPEDIELFCKETGTKLPAGGQENWGVWAAGEMKIKYDDWWHEKRAAFHAKIVHLLQSYRSDMTLYYYNWDEDKFGLIQPSTTAWAFVATVVKPPPLGGRAAYEREAAARKKLTAADYIEVLRTGNLGSANGSHINRADNGIRPSLYKDIPGIEIFAPTGFRCYADNADYLNYFRTADGLAVSNLVSYDEIGSRTINPKYEGNMVTPAGPAYSMALELLAYFHGDARTLNYTVYTYGRGFADAHRRFAQAFLALPAVPGTVLTNALAPEDPDVRVRRYDTANGTYVGIASKGTVDKTVAIHLQKIPPGAVVTDLVTGDPVPLKRDGEDASFSVTLTPMSLNSFLIK